MSTDNTPYLVIWFRSLAFWIVFPVTLVIFATLLLFTVFFSLETRWRLVQVWVNFILWWLKVTCKLSHEVQGSEHITPEAGIVFSKHQSTWETIALQQIFPVQVWVAKREFMWLPFFGWGLAMMKCIHIKRGRAGQPSSSWSPRDAHVLMKASGWSFFLKVPAYRPVNAGATVSVVPCWRNKPVIPSFRSLTMRANTGHVAALSSGRESYRSASVHRLIRPVRPPSNY